MKFKEIGTFILIGIVIVCGIVGITSTYFLGPDNPIEEVAEDVIEEETGKKVDLTPKIPEKSVSQE